MDVCKIFLGELAKSCFEHKNETILHSLTGEIILGTF
jgi:hypothetical protein